MQSFLAKCAALGIVAGGFTLTGDVGRLVERGQRLLDAQTVPSETPPAEPPAAVAAAAPAVVSDPAPAVVTPDVPPARAPQLDAPLGRTVAVPTPPAQGPDSLDLRPLAAGGRVLVWVRRQGAASRGRSMDLIALDLIDPQSGEALEHRHAAMTHGGESANVHAAPRRVVITLDSRDRLAKGMVLRLTPLHGVNGLGTEESLGEVLAIDVQGR